VTRKTAVFSDVTPCGCCMNRRFGGLYRLHRQDDMTRRARNVSYNCETSVLRRATRISKKTAIFINFSVRIKLPTNIFCTVAEQIISQIMSDSIFSHYNELIYSKHWIICTFLLNDVTETPATSVDFSHKFVYRAISILRTCERLGENRQCPHELQQKLSCAQTRPIVLFLSVCLLASKRSLSPITFRALCYCNDELKRKSSKTSFRKNGLWTNIL
jgi:hypothetical protein